MLYYIEAAHKSTADLPQLGHRTLEVAHRTLKVHVKRSVSQGLIHVLQLRLSRGCTPAKDLVIRAQDPHGGLIYGLSEIGNIFSWERLVNRLRTAQFVIRMSIRP